MSNKLTMTDLYNKLEKLGFSKEFIRAIGLPSWWVDALDESTSVAVMYEAAGYISKRLPIDLGSLINISRVPKFINNMTYEEVIDIVEKRKKCLLQLRRLGTDILTNDATDYFEQLLEYKLEKL